MAYINVAEWTPDHVAEWLRGLDDAVLPYVHFFLNNNIDGCRLLLLSPDDLNSLNVTKVGHQELVLEGIDLLRQLHYNLTSETLQTLALRLGCKARSLYNDLKRNGPQELAENVKQERVSVSTLSAVSDTLASVKAFISWLDRYPFEGQDQYIPVRKTILKLSIELASTAQRDQFVEKPHEVIKNSCLNLAELCDRIVQEFNDPLIIQPALLDVSTIKKKPDEELGMHIHSSYSGIHMIGGVKFQSPAHRCGKIEEGDEIIQVNYQTVVGWQLKKLVHAMRDHPTEIHLTLKKRPRHTNILGQVINLRPYRIPSKKTAYGKIHKWSEGNSSLHIQEMYPTPPAEPPSPRDDVDDDDDSTFLPDDATPSGDQTVANPIQYVFLAKSRATVQRRATVSGASPTVTRPPVRIEDLVAGTSLFTKEPVFRSVSHDPSKHVPPSGAGLKVPPPKLDTSKTDSKSEKSENKTPQVSKQQPKSDKTVAKTLQNGKTPVALVPVEKSNKHLGGKDTLNVPEINLQPHDEQYTILENKSLLSNTSGSDKSESPSASSETKGPISEDESLSNKLSQASDVSEVKDGDKISLQEHAGNIKDKALTINIPENAQKIGVDVTKETEDSNSQLSPESTSYQVTVIGGVPQKSPNLGRAPKSPLQSPFLRRKPNITSKFATRRVSCKDLGLGECEGWLYQRKDHKGFLPGLRWTKRWLVLKDNYLYCFRNTEERKAECLIYLPGFTVSPSPECKSRKFAFKLHHSGTTFYFATESQQAMTKWMNKMGLAAIAYNSRAALTAKEGLKDGSSLNENAYFSETDEESEEINPSGAKPELTSQNSAGSELSEKQGDSKRDGVAPKKDPLLRFIKQGRPEIAPKPVKKEALAVRKQDSKNLPKPKVLPSNATAAGHSRKLSEPIVDTKKLAKKIYRSDRAFSTGDAGLDATKLENNKNKPGSVPSFRMAYIRSLSCVDNMQKSPNGSPKAGSTSDSHALSPLKECNEFTEAIYEGGGEYSEKLSLNRNQRHSGPWSIHKEVPSGDMFTTASLDRQKIVGKDAQNRFSIASNVQVPKSSANTLLSRERKHEASAVRKDMPESFECEGKQRVHTGSLSSDSSSPGIVKCSKRKGSRDSISSSSSSANKNFTCSSDLYKVTRKVSGQSHYPEHVTVHKQKTETTYDPRDSDSSDSQSYQTMLDREYNRLYGRRKPDTIVLQQTVPIPCHRSSSSSPSSNAARGSPTKSVVSNRGTNKLPKSATSQEIHSLYTCHRESWGSGEDYFRRAAVRRSSSSEASVTSNSGVGTYSSGQQSSGIDLISEQARLKYASLPEEAVGARKTDASCESVQAHSSSPPSHELKTLSLDRFRQNADGSKKLAGAVDIPLDSSDRCVDNISKRNSNGAKAPLPSPKSASNAFKLFSSPKFVKKLGSPRLDKKNFAISPKKSPKAETSDHSGRWPFPEKILGSPRLARAIFGSKPESKHVVTTSAAVQTDSFMGIADQGKNKSSSSDSSPLPAKFYPAVDSPLVLPSPDSDKIKEIVEERLKTSSNSSLNSTASGSAVSTSSSSHFYVETRIRPQITISLPLVTESNSDDRPKSPETPRTPIKPTMGITMLGKKRTSSVSSNVEGTLTTTKQEVSRASPVLRHSERTEITMNVNYEADDDELIQMLAVLRKADVSLDGINLNERRRKTMIQPYEDRRVSQLTLSLRALKRTLMDKEMELEAIEQLFEEPVTSERLEQWALKYPHLLPPEYC